jgi:hypothetical protein
MSEPKKPTPIRVRLIEGVPLQVQLQVMVEQDGKLKAATIPFPLRVEDGAKLADLVELARAKAEHRLNETT